VAPVLPPIGRRSLLGGSICLSLAVLAGCSGTSRQAAVSPTPASGRPGAVPVGFDAEPAWTQPGGSGTLETLAWRPGQQQFASGSSDGQVRLWSSQGQPVQATQFAGFVSGLSWSPDGARLAVATTAGSGHLWLGSGAWPAQFPTQNYRYAAVAWRPDGTVLAVAGGDSGVRLDQAAGPPGSTLGISGQTTALTWSPDGKLLAAGNRAGDVTVWTSTRQQHWTGRVPAGKDVNTLAWSPDGTVLAAGYEDGNVRFLAGASGAGRGLLPVGRPVNAVAWSPDGAVLAVTSLRLSVSLWDAVRHSPLVELPLGYDVNDVVWSPGGDLLVAGADDHALHAWSVHPPLGPGVQGDDATGYMAR
jgi:WD40 repeat protein